MLDGYQHIVAHLGKGLHEVLVQVLEHMEAVERDLGTGEGVVDMKEQVSLFIP